MHRTNKGQAIPGVDVSAQVVNCFRAKYPNISLDKFAHLWVTEPAEKLANRYLEKVGETEDLTHCLRHRFFLESLQEFSVAAKNRVFINIGAGFTNYPHLLNTQIRCCEVDKPSIIKEKQQRLQQLQASQQLPDREILFIPTEDLNNPNKRKKLFNSLSKWVGSCQSFVLIEGVVYWLSQESTNSLFKHLQQIQTAGSLLAVNAFKPRESSKAIFQRLRSFSEDDYCIKNFSPNTLNERFHEHLAGHELIKCANYINLSKQANEAMALDDQESVLEEDCYLLRKLMR